MYITPLKNRIPFIFLEKCKITVVGNSFSILTENGISKIPIEMFSVIFIEPGVTISHSALKMAAQSNTLIFIISEQSTKIYSFNNFKYDPNRVKTQFLNESDNILKRKVAVKLLEMRFNKKMPNKRSINQLRGIEGSLMKEEYKRLSIKYDVPWIGRKIENFEKLDEINKCISIGNSCLYGIVEAAIVTYGYLPSIGFLHSGNERSFVFDIADIFKLRTVLPLAFDISSDDNKSWKNMKNECRNLFYKEKIMIDIFNILEDLFE